MAPYSAGNAISFLLSLSPCFTIVCVQPERQLVAFSRSWLPDIRNAVFALAKNPVIVQIGEVETTALPSDVTIDVRIMDDESAKKKE